MSPEGDSLMNLVYQWCMSSSMISSRLEQWVPIIPPEVQFRPEILQSANGEVDVRKASGCSRHWRQ